MIKITEFLKSALNYPFVFDLYQTLMGAPRSHNFFIKSVVKPHLCKNVLDIGCGVGASLKFIPENIEYYGIDIDKNYIKHAKYKFGVRGVFICKGIEDLNIKDMPKFDCVFAFGVLHHLDDKTAKLMIKSAKKLLKPGGKFASIDPCLVCDDSFISKFLIRNDRGQFIRSQEDYRKLFKNSRDIQSRIFNDLLNVPYSQIIFEVIF
jgi:SAM-dependent methyltransferase